MPISQQMLEQGLLNPSEALLELDRLRCEDSLSYFTSSAWRYIDPAPMKWSWHMDAMCEHLQAVAWGHIKRLIINVPPRSSKSTVCSVAFPAWVWAQRERLALAGPQVQFLTASYAGTLAFRDSLKARRLIASPWYQERWGEHVKISPDQDAKWRYDTEDGGYRLATSVDAAVTGEGGNIIIIDDAHNAREAQSKVAREGVIEWWDGSMSTRLNNSETDAFVVIMQRLHEDDLTGHILTNSREDWVHLCLPMRYEKDRHCTTVLAYGEDGEEDVTWTDPRAEEGELLAPSRFSLPSVERLERALGAYNTAGQLQQRPSPKGGGIFKRDWWLPWDWDPEDPTSEAFKKYPRFDFIVASLDTAYGEKQENDYSACTIWGVFTGKSHPILPTMLSPDGSRPNLSPYIDKPQVMLAYAWNERLAFPQLVDKVVDTCRKFKVDRLLIEAKASGLSVAQELRTMQGAADWGVELINPGNMDKVARAHSVSHMLENKLVWCPYMGGMPRDWADPVITQCANFPKGAHDDLVDSVTQALRWLRDCGFVLRSEEIEEEVQGSLAYRQQSHAPLYPGSR